MENLHDSPLGLGNCSERKIGGGTGRKPRRGQRGQERKPGYAYGEGKDAGCHGCDLPKTLSGKRIRLNGLAPRERPMIANDTLLQPPRREERDPCGEGNKQTEPPVLPCSQPL